MANKPIILHIAFILLLLNSCTSETEIPVSPNTLTLEIKAENFFPTDNSTTRTTDKGYETFFTDGDKIGITIVKGGKIVDKINNIPVTYNVSTEQWVTDGTHPLYAYDDATYLIYYPYDSAITGAVSEADLAGKLNSFIPNVDQSTRKNFAASDLMIGTGTLSGTELKVTLQHYMSLVVLCPQGNKYIAGDYEYHSLYTSITSLQAGDVTAGYEPGDGTLRFILPPSVSTDIAISYTTAQSRTRSYTLTRTPTKGKYSKINLTTGSSITPSTITLGDRYMANGAIVPKDANMTDSWKKNCLGLIFSLATSDIDRGHGWTHGYVMAAKEESFPNDIMTKCWSTNSNYDEPFLINCVDLSLSRANKEGYTETEALIDSYASDDRYGVVQQILYYRKQNPCMSNAIYSPWYVPSCGQWYDILTNLGEINMESFSNYNGGWEGTSDARGTIETKMNVAGGTFSLNSGSSTRSAFFHCSSESSTTHNWSMRFDDRKSTFLTPLGKSIIGDSNKGSEYGRKFLRPVLAF